ncbi:serine/threonine protein kinase [Ktedonospora formicarum]|uniref:non-specific serine/threonine protein kinase n=1 Tax=Ktedonospora formicarum TaxID=2778364 RepID=A0A8J3HR80_9CHLR|nr:serine/threonine-protein kinase [Ktedonospora formicarum]GHO42362.1 hypothetical protein KSX_05250 [Ktedonospora formicarum]
MKMYGEQDAPSLVGKLLGNYRLIRLLGRGSSAMVYLGEHQHLRVQAAIKVLHTHLLKSEIQRFEAEARTIAQLEHPNIVRVLEGGVEGDVPYLVMEYAPHGTLLQHYEQGRRYAPQVVLPHVLQIAGALSYAHQRRIIHRDIKPENVLLGPKQEALLSDFGLAVVAHNTRSQQIEEVAGSLYYMAPEVIEGYPRPASDQYALAALIYTWLQGAPPFVGTFREVASQHLSAQPVPLTQHVPGLAPQIADVIQRALAKDPHQRFPDIIVFAKAFEAACQGVSLPYDAGYRAKVEPSLPARQAVGPVTPEVTLPIEPTTQNIPARGLSRRIALGAMAATIVGVAALGGGAWWVWGRKETPSIVKSIQPTATQTIKPTTVPSKPFGTQLLVFNGHGIDPKGSDPNRISALAWSPNNKLLASADSTRVLVWGLRMGRL